MSQPQQSATESPVPVPVPVPVAVPVPAPVPARPGPTPSPALQHIEQAVTTLSGVGDRPLSEQPAAYEQLHRVLREALSDIQA